MKLRLAVILAATVGVAAVGVAALPAFADRTDVLYQNQSWEVDGESYDDGTYACHAQVSDPGESFGLWIFQDQVIRLQFYSDSWDLGDSGTVNLQVKMDGRSPWKLTDANLNKHSVLFDMPEGKDSVDFLVEVAEGSTLHLLSESGDRVQNYSLAGSAASISKLIDCGKAISGNKNPFK